MSDIRRYAMLLAMAFVVGLGVYAVAPVSADAYRCGDGCFGEYVCQTGPNCQAPEWCEFGVNYYAPRYVCTSVCNFDFMYCELCEWCI